jgi:mannosyltransferase
VNVFLGRTLPKQALSDNLLTSRFVYVPILVLAAGLRIFQLDGQSMWFDEAARLLVAQGSVQSIVRETGGDTLPPLYHLVMHFWGQLGWQDFYVRMPSALAGVALVAVAAALGRAMFDNRTGLAAAAIVALMPYQVFHSQQANLYAWLALLAGLQILFFWRAMASGGRAWLAAFMASAAAGIYVHYFAALVTLVLHVWLLLVDRTMQGGRYRRRWKNLLPADGFLIILCLPVAGYFLRGASQVGGNFWLMRPNLAAPLATLHLFTVSYSLSGLWAGLAFVLTLSLLAVVLLELAYAYRRRPEQRPALSLLFLLAFLPIVLVFLISQLRPIYLERTLIICAPAYALLMGRALARTRRRSPTPYLAGVLLALMVFSLYGYYFLDRYSKPDYRAAAAYVSQRMESDEALIHSGNGAYLPFLFYLGPDRHFILAGDPAPHHPARLYETAGGRAVDWPDLAGWPSIWLVVAFDHSVDYQEAVVREFDQKYRLLDSAVVDGIVLRRYQVTWR